MYPRLAWNSQLSCLHLWSAGITGVLHHTWLYKHWLWRSLAALPSLLHILSDDPGLGLSKSLHYTHRATYLQR
jgi:hypothetical protein